MSIARPSRLGMEDRLRLVFKHAIVRYLFAIVTVVSTFALRIWLIPLTGTGAPFVLFFAAVLVSSLFLGVGPGICALLVSLPLADYMFVTRAGYPHLQAAFQALLFLIDGTVVVYLTFLMRKGRQAVQDANRRLRDANEEITRSMARAREIIELAPDAFFLADLDARFTDVNQAACRLLGYDRDELIGKNIVDIISPEDVRRLAATREYLLSPGTVQVAEWTQLRKDGTAVSVEVSSKILPDGRWQAFVRDISERKRIERALQESEERFRLTIDEAPIGIALVGLDGRFVRVNRALCDIVGYTSAELMRLTFHAITHPDDVDTDRAAADQLVRGETPRYQREKRYLSKDGTIVDVMLSVSILRDREGTPRYFISQIEDIRERKRRETALKESEQRLSLALDAAKIGMWDLDLLADTSVRSLRHDQIFGYSSLLPAWGAALFMNHVVPEDRAVAKRAFEEALTSGNLEMECRILWADKSIHWISAKGRAYRDPQGNPVRMMGTVADITEHKRAEEAQQFLAEAGAVLGATLDYEQTLATVAQLVVRDFADWCIVEIMEEHEHLRRLKVASADPNKAELCRQLEQLSVDRDRPSFVRSVIETKQPLLVEHVGPEQFDSIAPGLEHIRAFRGITPTSLMTLPLLIRGEILGTMTFVSSTPSRTYGLRDLRLAEVLADRASVAIENARLYGASMHATRLRDQVLGVVAHDLRNPLSAILLQVDALKRHGPKPERRSQKPREVIRGAVIRMNRLIQDLLDIALMESEQLTIERARLSARALIVDAVEMQRPLASSSSLELRVDVDREVPEIWGDRERLLQVFENLIGNAIKFTEAGGRITVGAASRDHDVVFWVADTGGGIASEHLPRVFDRFWQATGAGRQGAGLGLPITKGIVEAHGGRIWVESTQGRGTTFSFTIPKASQEQDEPSGASASAAGHK
jgi:PAS domain S-box-containing protein